MRSSARSRSTWGASLQVDDDLLYVAPLRSVGPPNCGRIARPGEADTGYQLDMSSLAGGRPAGDFTLLDDQTALIRT